MFDCLCLSQSSIYTPPVTAWAPLGGLAGCVRPSLFEKSEYCAEIQQQDAGRERLASRLSLSRGNCHVRGSEFVVSGKVAQENLYQSARANGPRVDRRCRKARTAGHNEKREMLNLSYIAPRVSQALTLSEPPSGRPWRPEGGRDQ